MAQTQLMIKVRVTEEPNLTRIKKNNQSNQNLRLPMAIDPPSSIAIKLKNNTDNSSISTYNKQLYTLKNSTNFLS